MVNFDFWIYFNDLLLICHRLNYVTEMAERHNASRLLVIARELVLQIQTLIENK